ncbi:MAG: hypothetical protein Q8N63_02425 [Nanoarchaeota archaeon]|nr:hypothetical protein [Nanoarchaeota archaeon]
MKRGLKFILFLSLALVLLGSVNADANLALTGTPSFVNSAGGDDLCGGCFYGVGWKTNAFYLKDNNINNPIGVCIGTYLGAYSGTYTAIVDLDKKNNQINNVEYVAWGAAFGQSGTMLTSLYYNGGWNDIDSRSINIGGGPSPNPQTVTISGGPWYDVEKIRVYTTLQAQLYYCVSNYLYEMRVIGTFCGDGVCNGDEDCGDCVADCGCTTPNVCQAGICVSCTPNCAGKECGDDGCEGSCGDCNILYPGEGKSCNAAGICIPPTGGVFWADTNGASITQASIGSTVWMIYENKAGPDRYDFNIIEDDIINDDDIRTIPSDQNFIHDLDLGAEWIITQADFDKGNIADAGELLNGQEEFRFIVDGIESGDLTVKAGNYSNPPPITNITNPKYKEIYVINQSTLRTANINFTQISSDINDDLKLTWEFGDRTSQIFENIKKTGLGNTTHNYSTPGTKSIKLTAEEMSPPRAASEVQSASDATEIYVYGEGVIVFAIITTPDPSVMQEIDSRFVEVNASATHVINCSYTLAGCMASKPPASPCYVVNDTITKEGIWCYKFPQIEQDKIKMEWTFDGDADNKLIGNYSEKSKVVEFIKVFDEPGKHTLNLRASYTTL